MFVELNAASVQDTQNRCGPGRQISGGEARGPLLTVFPGFHRRSGAHPSHALKRKDSALPEALQAEVEVTLTFSGGMPNARHVVAKRRRLSNSGGSSCRLSC